MLIIKKLVLILAISLIILPLFIQSAFAIESNIDRYNEEFDFDSFLSTLDNETIDILSEIGIDEMSLEDIFAVKPEKVFDSLFSIVAKSVKAPLAFLTVSMGVLMITTLMTSFCESHTINMTGGASLSLCAAVPLAGVVTTAFSVLEVLNVFTTAFAGVFCALVSSSGRINTGISYAAMTMFSDTFFAGFLTGVSQPIISSMCALAFLSCFDTGGFIRRFSEIVKKIYVYVLSFIGTIFSGIVTLKGVLSDGADNLSSRSIRFVVGRSLPVVGGTVSETYSTLISSLSLIKNTVGVFGIITVAVIVLPLLVQLMMWIISLEICSTLSDIMGAGASVHLLSVLKDALILLVATITLVATVFIVSVGVVITAKGGGL